MAKIDGEIPPVDSKNSKMGVLAVHKRKNFPYLPLNKLHSTFSRKIFAYFTFADYSIKDKTSYLKGSKFYLKNPREPIF